MTRVLDFLRGLSGAGPADSTDRELLGRFLGGRDEAAFAEIVRRHGPLVYATCRRLLGNAADVEDAFQATFLVLVRRAARLPAHDTVGPWLHRVAVRVAQDLRRRQARLASRRRPLLEEPAAAGPEPDAWPDLDAALLRLPQRDRAAVVLCHLQGLSRREAAQQLGCPEGTLSALLARALAKLRRRLGAAVSVLAAVAVPADLAAATVRAAVAPAGVSAAVLCLTEGVLRMFWMKKLVGGLVAASVVLALGVGVALRAHSEPVAARPPAPVKEAPPKIDETIRKLQFQRRDLLRKALEVRSNEFKAGRGTLSAMFDVAKLLLDAELAVARKAEERIAAHAAHLELARQVEKEVEAWFQAGRVNAADHLLAQANRLEAEVGWLKAGGRPERKP
jgi:RNA polymerase sigma factor (sigma-70 family)